MVTATKPEVGNVLPEASANGIDLDAFVKEFGLEAIINASALAYGLSPEEAKKRADGLVKSLETQAKASASTALDKRLETAWDGMVEKLQPFANAAADKKRAFSVMARFPSRDAMTATLNAFVAAVPTQWDRPITLVLDCKDGRLAIGTRHLETKAERVNCPLGKSSPASTERFDSPKTAIVLTGTYPLASGDGTKVYARCGRCKRIVRVGQDGNLVTHTPA